MYRLFLHENCQFKKAILDSIFFASSGNSLKILPPATATHFCPVFVFVCGSLTVWLLFLVHFSCFVLSKQSLNGSHTFFCRQSKTNLHTLFFIWFSMFGILKSAFGGHLDFIMFMLRFSILRNRFNFEFGHPSPTDLFEF